jgi:hypothetical protein
VPRRRRLFNTWHFSRLPCPIVGLCLGLLAGAAAAADIRELQVGRRDDLFRLHLLAHLRASFPAAWTVLTDYSHLYRLTDSVQISEILGMEPDGSTLVRTRSHVCVWIFCKTLEQVQRLRCLAPGELDADSIPDPSAFTFGRARWRLAPEGRGTRFELDAQLRPGFWVPPLLGPLVIEQGLRGSALDALEGLERQAGARP